MHIVMPTQLYLKQTAWPIFFLLKSDIMSLRSCLIYPIPCEISNLAREMGETFPSKQIKDANFDIKTDSDIQNEIRLIIQG